MKELKDYTIIELKALKSDIYEELTRLQSNLSIINNELSKREKELVVETKEEVVK